MAVSLGAYAFGCGNLHSAPVISVAPIRVRRVEVFDVHGAGEVQGGRRTRQIPVAATYQAASEALLNTLLGTDDAVKNSRTPATLTVGSRTFSDCVFNGLEAAPSFYDGLSGNWVCHAQLHFESLKA